MLTEQMKLQPNQLQILKNNQHKKIIKEAQKGGNVTEERSGFKNEAEAGRTKEHTTHRSCLQSNRGQIEGEVTLTFNSPNKQKMISMMID